MFTGVLHTKSEKADESIHVSFNSLPAHSIGSLAALQAKEQQLYAQFGATDFQSFRTKLNSLLTGQDREILLRFSANYLSNALSSFALQNNELFGQDVKFVFDFTKIPSPNIMKFKIGGDSALSTRQLSLQSKGEIGIGLKYQADEIKSLLNEYFPNHFKTQVGWTKNLDDFMGKLTKSGFLQIYVNNGTGGANTLGSYTLYVPHKIENFPWGVVKQDIEVAEAMGTSSALYGELDAAVARIKKFIFDELGQGKSIELERAMNTIWNKTFSGFSAAKFFSGGTKNNFISGVQGALGEFQTAVIFEYLANKFNGNSKVASIIGDTLNESKEQLRTDVEIFERLGIQVKNYNVIGDNNELLRDLKTTIHPDKLSLYLDEPMGFKDFIANYYFNSSYQVEHKSDYNQLITYLEHYLGELMNLAMSDAISDTVAFYLINGRYLVPASAILLSAYELDLRKSITITGPTSGNDDAYFASIGDNKKPNFVKYWHHYHFGWRPTQDAPYDGNKMEYNRLISHLISIKTNFDPSTLMKNYAFL